MIFSREMSACLLGTTTVLAMSMTASKSLALTPPEIDKFASQTTVVIARGLKRGDIEEKREFDPGSGVIIAHKGTTYYALTNLHVVEHESDVYGVRTADGDVHVVDSVKNPLNIVRFGRFEGALGSYRSINGFDLAVVRFESNRKYPVAPVGSADKIKPGDSVYISGWPNPNDLSARRQRISSSGNVKQIVSVPFTDGGYNILYDNNTKRGMSGGPVFNQDGEVVGIHGRGRKQADLYCIDPELNVNNSCGIQTIYFINQAEAANLNLALNHSPVTPSVIAAETVNKDKADVIEDIYALFSSLEARLRDVPSGGSCSVNLGEGCEGNGFEF